MSRLTKTALATAVAIFALQTAIIAQKTTVSGHVTDAQSGEALPFTNVALMRAADTVFLRGTTTGFDGRFSISDADTGSFLLVASSVGYTTYYSPLHVVPGMDEIALSLQPGTTLAEVSITAERPLYAMDGEKNLYNTHDDPSVQTGTASDALQNAPGVEVDAEGNITLRGVSSVEIWVNDRPSHMNEEALKQYIKTLPANAIERIEVITNPSARYSTSGGVINIVTNQTIRRNELLCLGLHANTMPNLSPWVSYVYANEKFDINVYLNANGSRHRMSGNGTSTLFDDNGDTSRYTTSDEHSHSNNYGGYAGLNFSWNIDSLTNLSAWMGMYPGWNPSEGESREAQIYYPSLYDAGYDMTNSSKGHYGGGYGGFWLSHRFDTTGRRLSANFNGNLWNSYSLAHSTRTFHDLSLAPRSYQTENDNTFNSGSLSVDYVHPLAHGFEVETGIGASLGSDHGLGRRDTLDASNTYVLEILRSSESSGGNTGLNGYVTLLKRWGTFTAKIGIRAEQSWEHEHWNYLDGSGSVDLDTAFFGLVPSLHLSYVTKDFQSYSISYTRRFSNPSTGDLTTFRTFSDLAYSTGNPALLRSYTHNVEAAWNKFFMGFGNIGLNAYFHANTNERASMPFAGYAPEYFGSLLVNYSKPVNIGSSHTEGLEANITYRPTAMLNVRLNASVFNYAYSYDGDNNNRWSWSMRLNVWAKVWNKLELFANAHYSSPKLSLYSLSVPNKGIDFGLSTDLLDRRLSLFLNVNDIFGMAEWGENSIAPQLHTTGSSRFDSRFVSLGITWRIGKMELEGKARQGASDSTPQM